MRAGSGAREQTWDEPEKKGHDEGDQGYAAEVTSMLRALEKDIGA